MWPSKWSDHLLYSNFLNFSHILNVITLSLMTSEMAFKTFSSFYIADMSVFLLQFAFLDVGCENIVRVCWLIDTHTCTIIGDVILVIDITMTPCVAEKTCFWETNVVTLITCKRLLWSLFWEMVNAFHISACMFLLCIFYLAVLKILDTSSNQTFLCLPIWCRYVSFWVSFILSL